MALVQKTFADIITHTRASTGTYFDSAGVLRTAGVDVPRLDYDPLTLLPRGLLVEEQRTNLLTFSSEIDNAVWVKTSITITPNVIAAPDGSISGDKVVETAIASAHGPGRGFTTVAGTTYAFSLVCKAGEREVVQLLTSTSGFSEQVFCNFNLATGLVGLKGTGATATINPLGGGWYRCSISMLATSSAAATFAAYMQLSDAVPRGQNYQGDGTSGIYIWGAQLEAGSFPTSYIPTTTAQVTRAADIASVNTLSPWYNATDGTLFVDMEIHRSSSLQTFISWGVGSSATTNNFIMQEGNNINVFTPGRSITGPVFSAGVLKMAFAYGSGLAFSVNGGSPFIGSASILAADSLTLGSLKGVGRFANCHIRSIKYYPKRLTNAELQALTV